MTTHAAMIAATASDLPTQWLLARASGLLAYVVLTLAVVAGLTLKTRLLGRAISPAVITAVHRSLSFVGLGAVALHGALLALDTSVDVPLVSLFVPGLSGYRPVATGLGVIAAELWLLVHLSFRVRRRIGVRRWRALHFATFPLWGLAAAHGVTAGSDSSLPWVQQLYVWSVGIVLFLVAIRMGSRGRGGARPARPAEPARPAAALAQVPATPHAARTNATRQSHVQTARSVQSHHIAWEKTS